MPLPMMDETSRKRPIGYDPARDKFITYDEVVCGEEEIVPLESLSPEDLKKLVIERYKALPKDHVVQAISGPPYRRDELIEAIREGSPFGQMTVDADVAYLRYQLDQIKSSLGQEPCEPHEDEG